MDLFFINNKELFMAVAMWEIVWKGFALWYSAKRDHKKVFVLLLLLNTIGIFPIGYLVYIKWFEDKKKEKKKE